MSRLAHVIARLTSRGRRTAALPAASLALLALIASAHRAEYQVVVMALVGVTGLATAVGLWVRGGLVLRVGTAAFAGAVIGFGLLQWLVGLPGGEPDRTWGLADVAGLLLAACTLFLLATGRQFRHFAGGRQPRP